jgi:hypothetical protein
MLTTDMACEEERYGVVLAICRWRIVLGLKVGATLGNPEHLVAIACKIVTIDAASCELRHGIARGICIHEGHI